MPEKVFPREVLAATGLEIKNFKSKILAEPEQLFNMIQVYSTFSHCEAR